MSAVQVYDPSMCCSTGVCGPSVDPALTQFAADTAWLTKAGVDVRRYSLSAEPGKFTEEAQVTALLQGNGEDALPAVLVDGVLRCSGRYPTRAELAEWAGVPTQAPSPLLMAPADASDSGCGCGPEGC